MKNAGVKRTLETYRCGDKVKAKYLASSVGPARCPGAWFPGKVRRVNDSTVDIIYDDGDSEDTVQLKYVRRLKQGDSSMSMVAPPSVQGESNDAPDSLTQHNATQPTCPTLVESSKPTTAEQEEQRSGESSTDASLPACLVTHHEGLELHLSASTVTGYKCVLPRSDGKGYVARSWLQGRLKPGYHGSFATAVEAAVAYARIAGPPTSQPTAQQWAAPPIRRGRAGAVSTGPPSTAQGGWRAGELESSESSDSDDSDYESDHPGREEEPCEGSEGGASRGPTSRLASKRCRS